MKIVPLRKEGYQLLQDGALTLAKIEANGIRIDGALLELTKEKLIKKIRNLRSELEDDPIWKTWRRRYGAKSNLTSREQLAGVLHVDLNYEVDETTETGRASMDSESLQKFDNPFVDKLVTMLRYDKTLGTFLKGIERETMNGRLHPVFNLHTVRTYRSSSNDPNFQNFPVRDKESAELIRRLFVASPGSVLVENDFKGIEVSVSACYHKDQNFISYITTPGKDMHRDMAAQLYCLKPEEVSKDARYGAKNKFVFPQFYGDYFVSCAKSLWEWIEKGKLLGPKGETMFKHLKHHGITELGACDPESKPMTGTFEHHVKEVENDFWNKRFMRYGQWRKEWHNEYLERGYFDLFTGFRVMGVFRRNAVVNYPVQGAAFHCLLWTLIQVQKRLEKYRMKSLIVGQIHDSLIGDVRENELKDYLELVEETVTVKLRRHYEWLIVPLEVEYEICPVGLPWFCKREVKFKQGRFQHPTKPEQWTDSPAKFLRVLR